ncbi:NTP transferase domain-containing protein [Ferruginibacter sp.]|uniref:NTP transferase domain-containing protein n=1 Tax=Ferruginibacter sp. TaxID=1940288 RepID=UPI002658FE78|nr:NTP transferase domain-containing protein [Ferruginibacter sp.]
MISSFHKPGYWKKKEVKVILTGDLYGLVLAGGKGSRMNMDKGELQYHEAINQRSFLYQLLTKYCAKVFISCRVDQVNNLQTGEAYITDEGLYKGPLNGILSAHHAYPDKAWLVVAVDLPHLTGETIAQLINQRDSQKPATAYAATQSKLPEPLIAIWEPAALEAAETYIQSGSTCPRKFLIGQEIKTIFPADDAELFNANYYTDFLEAKNRMASNHE